MTPRLTEILFVLLVSVVISGCGQSTPDANHVKPAVIGPVAHEGKRTSDVLPSPEAPISEEEIRTVMGHVGPVSATEAAAVVLARRMMDIEELRAGRGSDAVKQVLESFINDVQRQRPGLSYAQAREEALQFMEQQATNFDERMLQDMARDLIVTSPGEARALIRTRRRLALAQRPAAPITQLMPSSPMPSGSGVSVDATLTYWKRFIELEKTAQSGLGKSPKGKDVAKAYREVAQGIARLPTLGVDIEVVDLFERFSKDFSALAVVYDRISTRNEDISYGTGKIIESALRGVAGDPFGATKEELEAVQKDNAKLEEVKERLRKNVDDAISVRSRMTRKYGIEFPPLD